MLERYPNKLFLKRSNSHSILIQLFIKFLIYLPAVFHLFLLLFYPLLQLWWNNTLREWFSSKLFTLLLIIAHFFDDFTNFFLILLFLLHQFYFVPAKLENLLSSQA